jgi:hypothetical protein
MAKRIVDACEVAGKPFPFFFNRSQSDGTCQIGLDGIVQSPHVTPGVQVQLLAVVDSTGSASVGDCIDALAGHPEPVSAILDMARAGYLAIEEGVLTEHRIVTRGSATAVSDDNGAGAGDSAPKPSAHEGARKVSVLSEKAVKSLEGSRIWALSLDRKLTGSPMRPEVFMLTERGRSELRPGGPLDRPVIYLGLNGKRAYVGMSGNGTDRLRGPHLEDFFLVFAITDASNTMTRQQALVGERVLGLALEDMGDYDIVSELPHGGACSESDYFAMRMLVGEALVLIRGTGFAFTRHSTRDLLAGPVGAPDMLDAELLPDVPERTLTSVGIRAQAVEDEDGDWFVKAGSQVRTKTVDSASIVTMSLRRELGYSGALVAKGSHFQLTRNLRFPTGSGAGNFVTGAKFPNRSGWVSMSENEG